MARKIGNDEGVKREKNPGIQCERLGIGTQTRERETEKKVEKISTDVLYLEYSRHDTIPNEYHHEFERHIYKHLSLTPTFQEK